MVTLLLKRRSWSEAIPIVHTLLKGKDENTYKEMWSCICMLATDPQSGKCYLQEYPVFISADFETALHNAIRALIPNSRIIGCAFHMRQAIFRNIYKSKFGKLVKEDMNSKLHRLDLLSRIDALVSCNSVESYVKERNDFMVYYRMKAGYDLFVDYMRRNWLGTIEKKAKFTYEIWSKCGIPHDYDLHLTNNLIEIFHKNINAKFSSKPNLKRCIEILQDIEQDIFTKKQKFENMVNLSPSSNSLKRKNTNASSQLEKRQKTQNNVTQAITYTVPVPAIMPNTASTPALMPLLIPTYPIMQEKPQASKANQQLPANNTSNQSPKGAFAQLLKTN